MIAAVDSPIGAFDAWLAGDGEARAGLPRGTTAPLVVNLSVLRGTMAAVHSNLDMVDAGWRDVVGENAVRDAIGSVLLHLSSASTLLDHGEKQAMAVSVSVNQTYRVLETHMQEDARDIEQARATIDTANRRITAANAERRAARAELEGWNGFGNGFLTSITLGIHNPVKENLDKAELALARATQERRRAEIALESLETHRRELAASRDAVARIHGVDRIVTALANDVGKGLMLLTAAHNAAQRSEARAGTALGRIYVDRAKPAMDKVVAWARQPSVFV